MGGRQVIIGLASVVMGVGSPTERLGRFALPDWLPFVVVNEQNWQLPNSQAGFA